MAAAHPKLLREAAVSSSRHQSEHIDELAERPPTDSSKDTISRLLGSMLDVVAPVPTLSPIRLATASGEVAERLMTAIALGEYLPGSRLPAERELASVMSVSRTAVREALAQLEGVGLIEVRRGRTGGAYVLASWTTASASAVRHTLLPRWDEFEHLLDLRALIDDLVGRVAAERATPQQCDAIEAALKAYRIATDRTEEQTIDAAFHGRILIATNNPQLIRLSRTLLASTSLALPHEPWGPKKGLGREEYARALADHEAIYAAIRNRDPDSAGRLSRAHFGITIETFRAVAARSQT